ncbi:MAG: efflux RND transporter periplasmic adaptor subunit, partial [Verrucomicrobiales bacterium]
IAAKTRPAYREAITNYLTAPATVVAAPGMSASIYPAVAGQIVKQEVALGREVQAGQVLGWIEPAFNEGSARLVDAQAEATRAQAQATQARQAFERIKSLHVQKAKSDRELQEAEAAFLSAEASFQAAQGVTSLFQISGAQTNGGALRVAMRSPVTGILEAAHRNPGERVQPDEPVYTVINSSAVQVEARLTPAQLSSAATGLNALFLPSHKLNDQQFIYPVEKVAVSQALDPVTRMGNAVYQLTNNPGLPIGSFGNIRIAAQVTTNTVVIPTSAIVDDEGLPVAFVQLSGETFEKRDLTLGIQDQTWTEVKTGIAEGERVVADGAYPLLLSTKSGTIPAHGHAH